MPAARITLSWTVNQDHRRSRDAPQDGRKQGYRHFNIKVAPGPVRSRARQDVRPPLRTRCFLWADANCGYDLSTALAIAPKLKDAGVNVLEQPVPANHLTALIALKKQGALPILLDEGLVNVRELEEFHKLGCLDGAAMKPARTAGLLDARRQVEYLERNKLLFLGSGLTDPDVALAAALVLYGAYSLKFPAALNGLQFLAGSFLKTPFTLQDGALTVPTGHGLGVEVDEAKVRNASHA